MVFFEFVLFQSSSSDEPAALIPQDRIMCAALRRLGAKDGNRAVTIADGSSSYGSSSEDEEVCCISF